MRIKTQLDSIDSEKSTNYAVYYEAQSFSAEDYEEKVKEQFKARDAAKSKKAKK